MLHIPVGGRITYHCSWSVEYPTSSLILGRAIVTLATLMISSIYIRERNGEVPDKKSFQIGKMRIVLYILVVEYSVLLTYAKQKGR
jgi:hypothetical protein